MSALADDLWLGALLDEVCTQIVNDGDEMSSVTHLYLSPEAYSLVSAVKARDVARGNPVMLLALDVLPDSVLDGMQARFE